jgi:RIO kinase 1
MEPLPVPSHFDLDSYDSASFSASSPSSPSSRGRSGRKNRDRFDDEDESRSTVRRGRLTDLERARLAQAREDEVYGLGLPDGADRWSTWGQGDLGPEPWPSWVITESGAVDTMLGTVKTGKEADVHLLERSLPGTDRSVLLARKLYRSSDHRNFHRDAGYLEGRRTKDVRESRAVANRTTLGLKLIAEQWAAAEFAALVTVWEAGVPVPYPVQREATELLLEFIGGTDGTAAPRLAQTRPEPAALEDLWGQLTSALLTMAASGFAHGDLSPYNILVHEDRLVLIDLPQIVDVVMNPRGGEFLDRDVRNVGSWFAARGLADAESRMGRLADLLRSEARLPPSTAF